MTRPLTSLGSQTGLMPAAAAPSVGDPYQGIRITQQAGAWSICLASFSGPEAPEFAHQMVAYIRNKYHVPAYAYDRADQQAPPRQRRMNAQQAYAAATLLAIGPKAAHAAEENCAILGGRLAPRSQDANAAPKRSAQARAYPRHSPPALRGLPPFPTRFEMVPRQGRQGRRPDEGRQAPSLAIHRRPQPLARRRFKPSATRCSPEGQTQAGDQAKFDLRLAAR